MRRMRGGRLLAGLAILFGIVVAPAAAQAAPASLAVWAGAGSVAPGYGYTQAVRVRSTAGWLEQPTVTFDLGSLAGHVTVKPSFNSTACQTSGATVTCRQAGIPYLVGGWNDLLNVTFKAAGNAPLGLTETITTTVTAGNVTTGSTTFELAISAASMLTANPVADVPTKVGEEFKLPITVTNNSSNVMRSPVVVIQADYGLDIVSRTRSCFYNEVYLGTTTAFCWTGEDNLQPGGTYELASPAVIRVREDHLAPATGSVRWRWLTDDQYGELYRSIYATKAAAAGAPGLALRKVSGLAAAAATSPHDTDATDNGGSAAVKVEGDNAADFRIWGSLPKGQAGEVVEAHAIVRDLGPASAMFLPEGGPLFLANIEVPPGTTVTKMDPGCAPIVDGKPDWTRESEPGAANYQCRFMKPLRATDTVWISFMIRIDKVIPNAISKVALVWPYGRYPYDRNPANENALIVVNQRTGGGDNGGGDNGGGDNGGDDDGGDDDGDTGGDDDGDTGGGGGGTLPITGAPAGALAGLGGAAVAAGLALVLISRRRRPGPDRPETTDSQL